MLTETTRAFRKQYMREQRILGTDLRDMKREKRDKELLQMTKAYLHEGYGLQHWPTHSHKQPQRAPEYPRDKDK